MSRFWVYPETSFWRRLGDSANSGPRKVSYRFLWMARRKCRVLVSKLTLAELARTPDPVERRHVLKRLWGSRPRLVTNSRKAERIAFQLLDAGGWSETLLADMLHVSYSMLSGADALVTWDRSDLARERTRRIVQAFGRREGLSVPLIGTPEDVAEWLELRI
jgi:hypothetical protein